MSKKITKYKTLRDWFFQSDIRLVQGIPFVIGLLFFIGWPVTLGFIGDGSLQKTKLSVVHLPFIFFLLGLSGVVGIIRRETYWNRFVILKGSIAVWASVIMTMGFVGFGIALLLLK